MSAVDDLIAQKMTAAVPQAQEKPAAAAAAPAGPHLSAVDMLIKDRRGQSAVDRLVSQKMDPVTQPARDVAATIYGASKNAVKAVGDVTGTLQRGAVGALYGAQHGGVSDAVGQGFYGAFHPNDEKTIARNDKNFRETTHLEDLKDEKSTDWWRKAGNFGVDTLGQVISDPATLIGAPLIRGALKGAEIGFKAIPYAEKAASAIAASKQFQGANDFFRASGDLRRTMTPDGVRAFNAMQHAVSNKYGKLIEENQAKIDAHADELATHKKGDDLHADVRNALDTAAWYAGTGDVRAAALKAGHVPEELAKQTPELNALTTYKPGYEPMQRITDPSDLPQPGIGQFVQPKAKGSYAFNLEQKEGDLNASISDRAKARIKQELTAARDSEMRHRATEEFGLDRNHFDTTELKGEMDLPETPPGRKAELAAQIADMDAKGKAASDRYAKYVKPGTDDVQFTMGSDAATRGGTRISNAGAHAQALKELGFEGPQFGTKYGVKQAGEEALLKPGSEPYKRTFATHDQLIKDLRSKAETEKDPKLAGQYDWEAKQEVRRNAAITAVTERQGQILARENQIILPTVLKDRMFAANVIKGEAPPFMKNLSNAAKDVMFLNPIPHIKNISVLMMQGAAGERGYIRGNQIFGEIAAGSKKYDAVQARLDNGGMRSNFFKEREGMIDRVPGLKQWKGAAHDKLWQYDTAQRIALLEYLDKNPATKALSEFEKGGIINDTLFDYAERSPFASFLEELGAPFPHWRLTNPSRQLMAVRDNPAGVNRIVNAEQNANEDIVQGKKRGFDVDFSSPVDELGKVATDPGHYFGGTLSTLTKEVAPYVVGNKNVQDFTQDVTSGSFGSRMADEFIPGASMVTALRGGRFPSKSDVAEGIGAGLIGAHPANMQSEFDKRVAWFKQHRNMDDFTARLNASRYHPPH